MEQTTHRRGLMNLRSRFRRGQRSRGQSLVEFALILPVLILFFGAILDLGRLAAAQLTVANASREGAFQAAQTPASYSANQACPLGATTNQVVCRVLLEAKNSVVQIQPSDISLACTPDCSHSLGHRVSVTVRGQLTLLMPFMAPLLGGSTVSFSSTSTTQLEALPTGVTAATPTPAPTSSASPSPTPSPTPSPSPVCTLPSAGFTSNTSPASMKATVTLTVTDTSTSPGCAITSWLWSWGDGTTSSAQNPGAKTYVAPGTFTVTLQVSNSSGTSTTGALVLKVK